MSAVTLIREAAKSGVWVGLNGGNLVAKLKANKAEIEPVGVARKLEFMPSQRP